MCGSFIAGVTKLPISQIYKFSFLKYIITQVTCKAGVMPELSTEGKANSSDGLKHKIDEDNALDDFPDMFYLFTLITLVKHGVCVAGIAEEFVLEDDIVHGYSCLACRTLQTVFMPH